MPKRVLLLAMNWGLGHTTRIIPVIREITLLGGIPVFAGTAKQIRLISESFPAIESVQISGLNISLSRGKNQGFRLAIQIPKILCQLIRENRATRSIVRAYSIDVIISDNVYGAFHSSVPSCFICHQINIKLPQTLTFMEGFINRINRRFIHKFNVCWIPDFPDGKGLAGELSHPKVLPANCSYVGPLSRFDNYTKELEIEKGKVLVLLSGPEPQRSLLENLIFQNSKNDEAGLKLVWVRGLVDKLGSDIDNSYPHLSPEKLAKEILSSEVIICRSGYSTIMDLVSLSRTAILVPTPGQTEQEYLAAHLSKSGFFRVLNQEEFTLAKAVHIMRSFTPKYYENSNNSNVILMEQIKDLLSD